MSLIQSLTILTVENCEKYLKDVRQKQTFSLNRKERFYNIAASFDIEVSSFMQGGEKIAIMYVWALSIENEIVITGRTWDEFIKLISMIQKIFITDKDFNFIIFVHNLSYEFQFFKHYFDWEKVFAIENREPVYAETGGIVFRCSYLLSGASLDTVAKNLTSVRIEKLTEQFDYQLLRHSGTVLTDQEWQYLLHDVFIVVYFIKERMKDRGGMQKIPLTKTGYVREFCRNFCFYGKPERVRKSFSVMKYRSWIKQLAMDPAEYQQLRSAFCGGFTHASSFQVKKTFENVQSLDFTSSYPAVMLSSSKFPCCRPEYYPEPDPELFEESLKSYFCVFDIEFEELEPVVFFEHYIPAYKCMYTEGMIIDNGRVVAAERLEITTTSIDYEIISKMYIWKNMKIRNLRIYRTYYLPKNFILQILKLYEDKTKLKGVEGFENEYLLAKEMLNSCYGMTVCNKEIAGESWEYDNDGWSHVVENLQVALEKYNKNGQRFLYYPWGLVVTAEARRNLFSAILQIGPSGDYLYSDTDSVKITNYEKHSKYFDKYNKWITSKIHKCLQINGIPVEKQAPVTNDGVVKPIGVWDNDGKYKKFKTLGAKRYIYEDDNGLQITIAGVTKKQAKYLTEKYGDHVFENFDNFLYFPPEQTGKLTHTYIDGVRKGYVIDYQGNEQKFYERSAVHLEPAQYMLSMGTEFLEFLQMDEIEQERILNL